MGVAGLSDFKKHPEEEFLLKCPHCGEFFVAFFQIWAAELGRPTIVFRREEKVPEE
jgi:hypothetical protein